MNKSKLVSLFTSFVSKAEVLLKNKKLSRQKVKEAFNNAELNKETLSPIWDQLQLLLSFAKDYSLGNYTTIPMRSIIAIFASLIYFVSPLDFIPDFIFGLGFIDDIYIITFVYKQVSKDLEKYKHWKEKGKTIIPI